MNQSGTDRVEQPDELCQNVGPGLEKIISQQADPNFPPKSQNSH